MKITKSSFLKYNWFYHQHTQYVMHWGWMIAGLILLCFFVHHWNHSPQKPAPLLSLSIEEPYFYAISKAGQPYNIAAQNVTVHSSGKFSFLEPRAQCQFKQKVLHVNSQKGHWYNPSSTLTLEKNVHIHDNHGQSIHTDCAKVLYRDRKVSSSHPTRGKSPRGTFQAQGFSWTDQSLDLHGPVTMTLHTSGAGLTGLKG